MESLSEPSPNPLTVLSLAALRRRRSLKWRQYPEDVLPLWIAEMDTPLPEPVRVALADAVARGDTGYVHPGRLAEAYARFCGVRFDWTPPASRIRVLPDVMSGVSHVLTQVTAAGDGVVLNPPVYPPFFAFTRLAGRRVVEVPLEVDGDGAYRLDLDALERVFAGGGVRAYLLCNPHNPTGTVFPRADLVAVADLAGRYGVRMLVDEIHAPLVYSGATHVPFLSLDHETAARAFVFGSASKAWNLPGLKAALVVAGAGAAGELAAIPAEAGFGVSLFGVLAGEAALDEGVGWLDALISGLDANRRELAGLLAAALPEVGYRPPEATYLAWLDCRRLGLGDDPAVPFLERGRVAVNGGPAFGSAGRGHVRLNFATAPARLAEAVRRMARAVERRAG